MINKNAIGYITANYASRDPSALVRNRPIASIPFMGRYRLIDFPLSNMMNAGIKTVGLVMPGNCRSLIDHVSSGKDWMLDRKKGGLFLVPGNPFGTSKLGMRFLLRDLIANAELFLRSQAKYVVMMASNIIFNLDLDTIIDAHRDSGAGVTMVYTMAERSQTDAQSLIIGERGRVQAMKSGCSYGDAKFMDCAIIDRELLLTIIRDYAMADYLDLFEAIRSDFERIDVCSYEFKGLVVGIFNERTYYDRSMDLLRPETYDRLFLPERPIITKAHDAPPAKYDASSNARDSLISAGCTVKGMVRGSILSRGVVVEPGAKVLNSIIMPKCVIGAGATVENAILDKHNVVAENTELRGTTDHLLVVGKQSLRI
ncbi:glucose-1-phosphate adenylyltransferase subunit GlgD [Collinsella sp. AGMB00827]|uniref:Glucose-1-phosphate adenylyltransferase subunit GlgD n=1 Tax=Collinsella ureilytica TaxID=2869515 RepID=A0ABS7MHJ7_9ACTN|nr:glucose-1-phosphate adenylyltransferase subunit GlgD [Collinsella urealyticum]MBY4796831.1 glucose-1-phosphate adenylyltransferase subunit GlgD [Collinsella urealyticum]